MSVLVSETDGVRRGSAAWIAAIAIFAFFSAYFYAYAVPLGAPPDELAHLTYVHEIAEEGRLLPDYEHSVVINSSSGNYLTHPPLYYVTLGLVGRAFDWTAVGDYRGFRMASAAMVALGIFFWSWVMVLWGWSPVRVVATVAATLAVPMFCYLAGSINNDNLAYLGVAIVFFAIAARSTLPRAACYVGGAGIVIVMLSKATAMAFITLFMLTWVGLRWRSGERLFADVHFRRALLLAAGVCSIYYLPTLYLYGELFPTAGQLYGGEKPGATIGLLEYARVFASSMYERLPVVMSHRSYAPISSTMAPVFYLMLAVPSLSWLISRPLSTPGPKRDLSDAFMLALLGTILIHLYQAYVGYKSTGLLAGIQPRYYSYALPGLFFIAFLDDSEFRLKQVAFVVFSCAAAICLAIVPGASAEDVVQKRNAVRQVASVSFQAASESREISMLADVAVGDAGFVDQVDNSRERILVRGWAIDVLTRSSASQIIFVHHGRLLGAAPTGIPRPDVARALGTETVTHSGFQVEIKGAPKSIEPCSIRVLAQQSDGVLRPLSRPRCPGDSPAEG